MSKNQVIVVKTPKKNEVDGLYEGYFCDYLFRAKLTDTNQSKNISGGRLVSAVIYKDACHYNKLNMPCGKRGVLFEINNFYNPDFYKKQLKMQTQNRHFGLYLKLEEQDVLFIQDFIQAINSITKIE